MDRPVLLRLCVVGLLLALLFVLNFCTGVGTIYMAVTDPASGWPMGRDRFTTRSWLALSVPDYQVRDGKLYLQVQVTRPSMLIVTFVSFGDWDAEKVRRFRRKHPELEPLWPDRGRPDGGVRWLRPAGPGR
jgi:hypothetical protein